MSPQTRALLIALAGPALSALGALWVLANVAIDAGRDLTLRYLIFDPGHLVIAAGVAVSIICAPIALEVASAEPEEVEIDLFEPAGAETEGVATQAASAEAIEAQRSEAWES